ncbi:MAG TPA: heavy metal-binding domain-containing protein [Bacteroidales bacterium]|nr:heavy metal-binding domain-containing protein [Bacteroidales bacterium]
MKTLNFLFSAILIAVLGISSSVQAQTMNMKTASSKTESLQVSGNCEMCKTRIEKAVKEEGATAADWDQKTKLLTLTFDPSKSNIDKFAKKVASVGHDTEKYKADDKVYKALPECCKYDRTTMKMQADYNCPMHSDVHSNKPGKCPKCGMALVKKDTATPKSGMNMHDMDAMHQN